MNCNDTMIFLKELNRMCNSFSSCYTCKFDELSKKTDLVCGERMKKFPTESIEIVQKWSDENPREIDWTKVPIGTPVNVKQYNDESWKLRYFVCYLPCAEKHFIAFSDGAKQSNASELAYWYCCKLAPEVDQTPYLKED